MPISPTITLNGLAAVLAATNDGLAARITHIALGDTAWSPDNTAVALRNERQRIEVSGGTRIQPNQIHITAVENGNVEYWIRELGFILDDGTMLAVWSDPEQALAFKAAGVDVLLALDLVLSALPDESVTVDGTGGVQLPPATETVIGVSRFASEAEMTAGERDDVSVTPNKIRVAGDARYSQSSHDHDTRYSRTGHNHRGVYAVANHAHDVRYSRTGHTHRGVYAAASHNHDSRYSRTNHNHSGVYATASHNHDTRYSRTGHSHSGVYAAASHNHDSRYSRTNHNHSGVYSAATHNHDSRYASRIHDHNGYYATTGHSHDLRYASALHDHDRIYFSNASFKVTSGVVAIRNRRGGEARDGSDDWEHNFSFVTPPVGFMSGDLKGFIPSVQKLDSIITGRLNIYRHIVWCKWRREPIENRVRVICASSRTSDNGGGISAHINYIAIWHKIVEIPVGSK